MVIFYLLSRTRMLLTVNCSEEKTVNMSVRLLLTFQNTQAVFQKLSCLTMQQESDTDLGKFSKKIQCFRDFESIMDLRVDSVIQIPAMRKAPLNLMLVTSEEISSFQISRFLKTLRNSILQTCCIIVKNLWKSAFTTYIKSLYLTCLKRYRSSATSSAYNI